MTREGVVLKTRPHRDHDLIVELLTAEYGRLAVIARAARKSNKRFGGALELGTKLQVEIQPARRGPLSSLSACSILRAPRHTSRHLERIYQLAYVLEIMERLTLEGQEEWANTAGLEAYLELLEDVTPTHADLVNWELWVLRQNGYEFQLWPCTGSGLQPDAFSLSFGGAISTAQIRANDTFGCPSVVLKAVFEMGQGNFAGAGDEVHGGVRRLLNHIWNTILDRPLKSASFIGPGSF